MLVLDCMCGVGSTVIEAAAEWPLARYVAGDSDEKQLALTTQNVAKAGVSQLVSIMRVDAAREYLLSYL